MHHRRWIPVLFAASLAAPVAGCSRETAPVPPAAANNPPEAARAEPQPAQAAGEPAPPPASGEALDALARARDPFQAFAPGPAPPPRDDRVRKARRFAVDQLKLVGIVRGAGAPRAMVVDPRGKGWVIAEGELLGRAETVRADSGERLASYRVDRIRERDVVLVRQDESAAAGPTRVLALPADPTGFDDDDEAMP